VSASRKPQQLTLEGLLEDATPSPEPVFVLGVRVDRSGAAQYTHLIRGAVDPERSPRPVGGREDRSPHLTLSTIEVTVCREQILTLLSDGCARTFNAIGVELLDHTADTLLGSPYDVALWQLVDEDQLEHTLEAPILFRVAEPAETLAAESP
jgi:hypothetical protein